MCTLVCVHGTHMYTHSHLLENLWLLNIPQFQVKTLENGVHSPHHQQMAIRLMSYFNTGDSSFKFT